MEQREDTVAAIHQEIIKFQQTLLKWLIGGIVMVVLSLFGSAMTAAYYLGQRNDVLVGSIRNELKAEIGSFRNEMRAEMGTINERINALNNRIDDMNRRFEDLKQVVLSRTQK